MFLFLFAVENDVFTDVFGFFYAKAQSKLTSKAYLSSCVSDAKDEPLVPIEF